MCTTCRLLVTNAAIPWLLIMLLIGLPCYSGCGNGGGEQTYHPPQSMETVYPPEGIEGAAYLAMEAQGLSADPGLGAGPGTRGDQFAAITENRFVNVSDQPRSTFSTDVDTASYAKTRMYLLQKGVLPPAGAVRIEEFVNYFPYDYSPPSDDRPFKIDVETAPAPWQPAHQLVRIAVKGREIEHQRPPCNLVFLIDVSGSMDDEAKLPLVKQGLRLLASQLDKQDRVAIVVYAGAAGLVLPSVPGDRRRQIQTALDRLQAGGSTNGGEGIHLAYQLALDNFIASGVNRVLLCSDGDFNVGTTSMASLVELAEEHAQQGVYLSVLGFGIGNHNDAMLEKLSNRANGNYAFIDSAIEARKVLAEQIDSTLVAIAKDVKIQVDFNPATALSYRLLGYENRLLQVHEFNDDQRDAGEIGAGHCVTAFYEVAPVTAEPPAPNHVDPLRYQTNRELSDGAKSGELLTVRLRYKPIDSDESELIEQPVLNKSRSAQVASSDFRFAAAVAAFAMLLRNSEHCGTATYDSVREIARDALGRDRSGYRAEFLQMVDAAQGLTRRDAEAVGFLPLWKVRP